MFTDTHSHPYYTETPDEALAIVQRAISAGVDRIIMPNVDLDSVAPMTALAQQFPDNLRMAMGLHPTGVNESADDVLSAILDMFEQNDNYIAVGEVGIDLYWDSTFRNRQMDVFDRQLGFASAHNLPVIIHCRNGLDETLECLSGHRDVRAVFHSFGGTVVDVESIRSLGDYFFGINGIVTFKNSTLRSVLPAIPTDRILLETDAPYLAPVPHRGKKNESSFLPFVAATVAEALETTVDAIASITAQNSIALFGF